MILEALPEDQRDESGPGQALPALHHRAAGAALGDGDASSGASGPLNVGHQGQLPAVVIGFNTPPGVALGDAVNAIRAVEQEMGMPPTIVTGFSGAAQVFQQALAGQGWLVLAAILIVYVVLGVLYESLIHPLTILSGLPAAALGAFADAVAVRPRPLGDRGDRRAAADRAGEEERHHDRGRGAAAPARRRGRAFTAVRDACLLRFRPIMMTTLAAGAGAVPIAAGWGAAAELRQPLGLAVVGGLAVSQVLTLFVTPVLYLGFDGLARRFPRGADAPRRRAGGAGRVKIPALPFTVTDWSGVPETRHPGETGHAVWRTLDIGDLRVRQVEYSPGYLADHWCDRGHVLLVLEGELETELQDGRRFALAGGELPGLRLRRCSRTAPRPERGEAFIVDQARLLLRLLRTHAGVTR